MNLAKAFKAIKTEVYKKRADEELSKYLLVILDEACMDFMDDNSVEVGFRDVYDEPCQWDDTSLSFKQRKFYHDEAKKRLKSVCRKLNKFGFKCTIFGGITKASSYGDLFHTPGIIVKF
jgi:hypothetical protein